MTAAMITQLIITFGPQALALIEKLIELWEKPELTKDEVLQILSIAQKSYDQYIAEAKAVS